MQTFRLTTGRLSLRRGCVQNVFRWALPLYLIQPALGLALFETHGQRRITGFAGIPIRQPSMMPGNEISQYPAVGSQVLNRVDCPRGGMIHSSFAAFDMSFRIIAGSGFDIGLECRAIFPEIVPKSGKRGPIGISKGRGESICDMSYIQEMIFKLVYYISALLILAHVRYILRGISYHLEFSSFHRRYL